MKPAKEEKTRNCVRSAALSVRETDGEGEAAKKEIRVSVSSESADVARWCYDEDEDNWVYATEILGHKDGEIDFTRCADGLVIQDTHYGDQIGLMRELKVEDGKLGGVIEFCSGPRAQEIKADAEAGLRRNMSVGYMVEKWTKVEEGDRKAGKLPIYRAVKWMPYEASFVNVPADIQVGVGREADAETTPAAVAANNERSNMEDRKTPAAATPAAPETRAEQPAPVTNEVESLRAEVKELRAKVAEKPEMPAAKRGVQLDEGAKKEIRNRYSLMKVVNALAGARNVDTGFEREMSDEIEKKTGRSAQGFFIPEQVLMGSRAFDKATYGGNLVATDTLFGELVPALVAETILGKAGARVLSGLVGDIKIPTAGGATGYWVTSEGGDATETTPNIGQLPATPHTCGAYTDITRKLMNQSGISAEAFVADALRSALARSIETAAFSGSGSSGQPTGLDSVVGTNTVSSATNPTLAKILEFISTIDAANATGANQKFIGTPAVWALLGSTLDIATIEASGTNVGGVTSGKYLLDTATNTCQGYEFIKSNLSTAKKLYFGDWSKLCLAFWSGVDLTVDTASLSKSGGVRLVALQDVDVICTQPKAFAIGQVIS